MNRSGPGGALIVSATQPSLVEGDLWWDSTNDILYVAIDNTPTLREMVKLNASSQIDIADMIVGLVALR